MKKTIAIDFDGVLHSYTSGWKGPGIIPDPPVPGMADACHQMIQAGFEVVVMSSRARHQPAAMAMASWLINHGFPPMKITAEKVPAEVYIDDRGYRFNGDAQAVLAFVQTSMRPWNKGEQIPGEAQ